MNTPRPIDDADLERRFAYHPPKDEDTKSRHEQVRRAGRDMAVSVINLCPPGRETSLAVTAIEEAMMWANAAIARGGAS